MTSLRLGERSGALGMGSYVDGFGDRTNHPGTVEPTDPLRTYGAMQVPIRYLRALCGYATVDDDSTLPQTRNLLLRLSPKLISQNHTPDVIIALLMSDPYTLHRCTPRYVINYDGGNYSVPLSHVILRPELAQLLDSTTTDIDAIREVSRSVGWVVHVNKNKTDCRRENLRQVSSQ